MQGDHPAALLMSAYHLVASLTFKDHLLIQGRLDDHQEQLQQLKQKLTGQVPQASTAKALSASLWTRSRATALICAGAERDCQHRLIR